jgi:hypothetical protein
VAAGTRARCAFRARERHPIGPDRPTATLAVMDFFCKPRHPGDSQETFISSEPEILFAGIFTVTECV